ncbi:MAG: class I SAM-dependent methyltransferase [Burkholderiales bacterium]|nr:class I SAM-dependent methyltransferase [Burkholderiales bacterium]
MSLPSTPSQIHAADSARKMRFWNWIARRYAANAIADQAGYETTLQRVRELLNTEHEVLELGCGTGSTALRLAPHTARLLATDLSPAMLVIARERLQAQPRPQLEFALADVDGPDFESARYDRVLAFNLLHLSADLDQTLATVVRTLRPSGLLISKTPCLGELNPLITRPLALLMRVLRAVGRAPHMRFLDEAQLSAAMQRAGLQLLASERHGTRGKDMRAFIVARKPAEAQAALT